MAQAHGPTAAKQTGGLLDRTSLKVFRSELTCFLELPGPFRQRLERLAAEAVPDRDEMARAYRAMPVAAARALTFVLSLDADDFSKLRKQVGAQAKELDDIRERFDPLARPFKGLDDLSEGIVNSWETFDLNVMYNFSRKHPSLELWLFDAVGKEIFYSRSDVDDFGSLAETVLGGVADSIEQAKEHGLPLCKFCTENMLDAVTRIEEHCRQIRKNLSRK
jgi:hypothetical protein